MTNMFRNFIVRSLINEYFGKNAKVKYAKPSKGTVRFQVTYVDPIGGEKYGEQGFYRLRTAKDRVIGGTPSEHEGSFRQMHMGKYTIGVENQKGRDVWNFAYSAE